MNDVVELTSSGDDNEEEDEQEAVPAPAAITKPAPRLIDLPPQYFSPEVVKWLLLEQDSSTTPELPKLTPEAIHALGEVLTIIVQEATKRSKTEAEEKNEMRQRLRAQHLLAILPKLLLDF